MSHIDSPEARPSGDGYLESPTRPGTLTEWVYQRLLGAIATEELAPGTRLIEADLAERLGVSKTPIREAMLRLRDAGIVEPDGARGGRVLQRSDAALRQAFEMREALEPYAARLCALRASVEQVSAIGDAARTTLDAAERGSRSDFRSADHLFHTLIAQAARNERLGKAIEHSILLASVLRDRDVASLGFSVSCANDHLAIAAAIEAKDQDGACALMRDHVVKVHHAVAAASAGGIGDGRVSAGE